MRFEIATSSFCPVNCRFCPQEVYQKAYRDLADSKDGGDDEPERFLTLKNFASALSSVPKNVVVQFSGFCEPFTNPNCVDMIEYAYDAGYPVDLFTTLVGLKSEDVERLTRIKFVGVCLHLPDNLENAHIPTTENYKNVLTAFLTSVNHNGYVSMNTDFKSNGRAGNCKDTPKIVKKGWFMCNRIRHPSFVMLPNCDVVLCCMDFGLKHVLGNLLEQSYMDIANTTFKKLQRNMYKMKGDILCRSCQIACSPHQYLWKYILSNLQ